MQRGDYLLNIFNQHVDLLWPITAVEDVNWIPHTTLSIPALPRMWFPSPPSQQRARFIKHERALNFMPTDEPACAVLNELLRCVIRAHSPRGVCEPAQPACHEPLRNTRECVVRGMYIMPRLERLERLACNRSLRLQCYGAERERELATATRESGVTTCTGKSAVGVDAMPLSECEQVCSACAVEKADVEMRPTGWRRHSEINNDRHQRSLCEG